MSEKERYYKFLGEDFNADRDRYYGLRVGDLVEYNKWPSLILIILLFFSIQGMSQEPDWKWVKRGGGTGTWNPSSSSADDETTGIVTDKFGNTTVCGRFFFSGSTNIDGQSVKKYGTEDGFVAQFDCNGKLRWKFSFGASLSDKASDISIDTIGNVYLTGQIGSSSQIADSIFFGDTTLKFKGGQSFIAKVDTLGEVKWLKVAFSGNNQSYSRGLSVDCNNKRVNVLLWSQGTFNEYSPGDTVSHGYLIASYSLNGNLIKVYKVYDYSARLELRDISIDANNSTYLAGTVQDSINFNGYPYDPKTSGGEAIVLRFDKNGSYTWGTMSTPPGTINIAHGWEIQVISNQSNSFYLVGQAYETSKFGNLPILGGNGMTGYLVKYSFGSPEWLRNLKNASAYNEIFNISIDHQEDIYVAGSVLGTATFAGDTMTSRDIQDPFIAKFDKGGNGIYAKTIPCKGDWSNRPKGIAVGYNGNVFLTGIFESRIEIPADSVYSQGGNTDFFIAKFGIDECEDTTTTPIDTSDAIAEFNGSKYNQLNIYPNPTSGQFTIKLEKSSTGELKIYNVLGSKVFQQSLLDVNSVEITLPQSLGNGVYLVQLISNDVRSNQRLVLKRE